MATRIAGEDDDVIEFFEKWLSSISNETHRLRAAEVLRWVTDEFPQLEFRLAWRQPMFTHHGTFIIGFSPARNHLAFAPEGEGISRFAAELDRRDLSYGAKMVRLPWDRPIPFNLLREVIQFNIEDKAGVTSFWR